jgi:hypothetical protein
MAHRVERHATLGSALAAASLGDDPILLLDAPTRVQDDPTARGRYSGSPAGLASASRLQRAVKGLLGAAARFSFRVRLSRKSGVVRRA